MKKVVLSTIGALALLMAGCSGSLTKEEAAAEIKEIKTACEKELINLIDNRNDAGIADLEKDCNEKISAINARIEEPAK